MKNRKLSLVTVLVTALVTVSIQGCGGVKSQEDILAEMQEFATPDDSASIYLEKDWEVQDIGLEDAGIDYWLCAGNKTGSEIALLMQFPKKGTKRLASDMDEVKEMVETSYGFTSDGAETEAPEVPGMTNVEADTGKVQVQTTSAEAYMVYGETDYAYYAIMYGARTIDEEEIAYVKASCSKFKETVPEEEDATTVELTDTVRWFNASYAVLTEVNGWDYNRFAGLPANEESMELEQESLKSWWDVTDRASADETLDWVLTEGHRTDLAETMEAYGADGLADVAADDRAAWIYENYQATEDQAEGLAYWYNLYEEKGDAAIGAWDYSRAMSLCGFYYLAGYYTETEALDKSLEIASTIQGMYSSWDEFMESYFAGYEWWAEESSDERRAVYEELKAESDSPYNLDFGMTLEKSW